MSSYGIINHYNTKQDEILGDSLCYRMEFSERYSVKDINDFWERTLPVIERKLKYYYMTGFCDGYVVQSSAGYDGTDYTMGEWAKLIFPASYLENFNDSTVKNKEHNVIVSYDIEPENGIISLAGIDYNVVAVTEESLALPENIVTLPYTVFPKECSIIFTSIWLDFPLTETEYNKVREIFYNIFPEIEEFPEFDGVANESEYRLYKNMMLIICAMVLVCGINYGMLYQYLITRNRKAFAVIRICGCSRMKALAGYLIEMLAEAAVLFCAGLIIFDKFVLRIIDKYYEYAVYYYNAKYILLTFATYMGVLFAIYAVQIIRYVRTSPSGLIKEVE